MKNKEILSPACASRNSRPRNCRSAARSCTRAHSNVGIVSRPVRFLKRCRTRARPLAVIN